MRIPLLHSLLAGAALLSMAAPSARAEIEGLAAELFDHQPPYPDWEGILNKRIAEGHPLPVLPEEKLGPTEDASPAEFLAYWREEWPWRRKEQPSEPMRGKILQAVQAEPAAIPQSLKALPPGEATAKILVPLLDKIPADSPEDRAKLRETRAWIFRHSGLLRDEVMADAKEADWGCYAHDEHPEWTLDALIARDPQLAAQVLLEHATGANPGLATACARLLAEKLQPERAEHWRTQIKAAAANTTNEERVRQVAVEALLRQDWPGREQWILEFIQTPDVGKLHWFAPPMFDAEAHWFPLLLPMLGSDKRHVHDHAAYLIARLADRPEFFRPLLPWLKDEAWAENYHNVRLDLIQELEETDVPECVPFLIELIQTDKDDSCIAYACLSLQRYKPKEAILAMKTALGRCGDPDYRKIIVQAIAGLDGFSAEEIAAAIEASFVALPDEAKREGFLHEDDDTRTPEVSIGMHFTSEPTRDPVLLQTLSRRADAIAKKHAEAATALRNWIASSPTPEGRAMMAKLLGNNKISSGALIQALEGRRDVTQWDGSAFSALSGKAGQSGGFAAVMSGDLKTMNAALDSRDQEKRIAVLAAAWISGDFLDLSRVMKLSKSNNEDLADAADAYLSRHPDPKAIEMLEERPKGASLFRYHAGLESMLRDCQALPEGEPQEIFALQSSSNGGSSGSWYVIAWPESALAVQAMGQGRLGFAKLPQEKLAALRHYVSTYRGDELPPLTWGWSDGVQYRYSHATAAGIERVAMDNPPTSWPPDEADDPGGHGQKLSKGMVLYAGLIRAVRDPFKDLKLDGRYASGAEILIPRETAQIRGVWKDGEDLRVLVNEDRNTPHWRRVSLADKILLDTVAEPAGFFLASSRRDLHPDFQVASDYHFRYPWQVRSGDATIHAGKFKDVQGLWRCRVDQEPELVAEGDFLNELVSSDGQWCVAAKAVGASWAEPNTVVRIKLETKEVFPVDLPVADDFHALAFVDAHGKFLIRRSRDHFDSKKHFGPKKPEFHLMDPASGELEKVSGNFDFWPMGGSEPRPLQPTGEAFRVWAVDTVPHGNATVVGKYDQKAFTFTPVMEIEGIRFDSTAMWVDEAGRMIYAQVNGDLVRVPMK